MAIDITNPTIPINYIKFPYAVKPFNWMQTAAKVVMVAIHLLLAIGLMILFPIPDIAKLSCKYISHMWENKNLKSIHIIIDTSNDYELKMLLGKIRRLYEKHKDDQLYFECYGNRLICVTKEIFDELDKEQKEAVVTCLDKITAKDELKDDYAKEINVLKRIATEIFISLNPAQNGFPTLPNNVLKELILGRIPPKDIETAKQVSHHFNTVATHHAKILSINNGRLNLRSVLPPHITKADEAIEWLEQDKVACRHLTYADLLGFDEFNEQHLKKLTEICPHITHLIIMSTELTVIEQLPSSLTEFTCFNKNRIKLPELPASLTVFGCGRVVGGLPKLPDNLKELTCLGQRKLPKLPNSLEKLDCRHSTLTKLPPLPATLKELSYVNCNALTEPPILPNSLEVLGCSESIGPVKLPELPALLRSLRYENCNTLTELPELPLSLKELFCIKCPALTKLPELSPFLISIDCEECDMLTDLPELPPSLTKLVCKNCPSLIDLPTLPDSLIVLDCRNSPMEVKAKEAIIASKFLEDIK